MNVLVLGGRIVGVELARELIGAFLKARFTGEERPSAPPCHDDRARKPIGSTASLRPIGLPRLHSPQLDHKWRIAPFDEDGLRCVTSNPAIFEKAIAGNSDYSPVFDRSDVRSLDAKAIYEQVAIEDIRNAADALRSVYHATERRERICEPGSLAACGMRYTGPGPGKLSGSGGAQPPRAQSASRFRSERWPQYTPGRAYWKR
jgi:transaldolase/glucose-6-phosphate isomerase